MPAHAPAPAPAPAPARAPGQVPVAPASLPASACRPAPLAGDLRVALTLAVRRLRLERSSEQISDGQYAVLATLANRGPMTPSALADDQHVAAPGMTRMLNALVEVGLVRRGPHPTDGRQVLVAITDAGEAEVKETRRRRNAWLAARLAELDPADREVLARATALLNQLVER